MQTQSVKIQTIHTYLKLLHDYPINKINVKLICDETNISRTSFYNNFESKDDLTYKAELLLFKKVLKPISTPPSFADVISGNLIVEYLEFKDSMDQFINLLYEHRFEFSALCGENGDPNFYKNFSDEITYLWRDNIEVLSEEHVPRIYEQAMRRGLFISIFVTWIEEDFKTDPLKISTIFTDANLKLNQTIIEGPLDINDYK